MNVISFHKSIIKLTFVFTFLLSINSFATHFKINFNEVDAESQSTCSELKTLVKEGDIIFTAVKGFVFSEVADLTQSWATHVGIVFKHKGQWVVYESKIPKSKITPICEHIDRSEGYKVELKRLNQYLSPNELIKLQHEATERLGISYHTGFDYDNNSRYFCSKYVHNIFKEIGIQIGEIESFVQLFKNNPQANVDFWTRWYLGKIPWQRRTVTPASQYYDSKLHTVYSKNIN